MKGNSVLQQVSSLDLTRILMVLSSHIKGFWLEEFAAPYYVFKDAGVSVEVASPLGGWPHVDPLSEVPEFQSELTRRFEADPGAKDQLERTHRIDAMTHDRFSAVFYPGGLGPLWDLAGDAPSVQLIESFIRAGKLVALVCHGPAALRQVKGSDGEPLVKGRNVTAFSNAEAADAQIVGVVPFLIEDMLKANGARFSAGAAWAPHVVVDGPLITGQNPASARYTAAALLKLLAAS